MPMPLTRAERQHRRDVILERRIAQAEYEARHVGRSLVCADNTRHETCVGAAHCLCECHDPKEDA